VSPFSPKLAVAADGKQVWCTRKDTCKTQGRSAEPPFTILGTIDSGPITNHVATVDLTSGHFAYVTVGGTDEVKVYRRDPPFEKVATIAVGALPHGVWSSPDGSRVYVGLENDASIQAIDTGTNKVIATIPSGQLPQALVYVPRAAAHSDGNAISDLIPLSDLKSSKVYRLLPKEEKQAGRATVTVISLGLVDQIQIAASSLVPGQDYTLQLEGRNQTMGNREELAKIKSSPSGSAIANTLGTFNEFVAANGGPDKVVLVLEPAKENSAPALVQRCPRQARTAVS